MIWSLNLTLLYIQSMSTTTPIVDNIAQYKELQSELKNISPEDVNFDNILEKAWYNFELATEQQIKNLVIKHIYLVKSSQYLNANNRVFMSGTHDFQTLAYVGKSGPNLLFKTKRLTLVKVPVQSQMVIYDLASARLTSKITKNIADKTFPEMKSLVGDMLPTELQQGKQQGGRKQKQSTRKRNKTKTKHHIK